MGWSTISLPTRLLKTIVANKLVLSGGGRLSENVPRTNTHAHTSTAH